MSSSNRLLRLALFYGASAVFFAPLAAADPLFPERLAKDLGMPCIPSCTVCHKDTKGGFNTLRSTTNRNAGFGQNLKDKYDLNVGNLASLETALGQAAAEDVDGDGTPDLTELKQGSDPNDPANALSLCGPEFGCVRVARRGPLDGVASTAGAAVLLLGLAALRRRRARS